MGDDYSWLSSSFYFGWLIWAIPSNLLMQRSPPAYYLAFNIFMWGALLMCQAAVKNLQSLLALRILSGAFEAIADPAFMLITSMYYTRAEQPSRISAWYAFNGVGVAGGGLIGKFAMVIPPSLFYQNRKMLFGRTAAVYIGIKFVNVCVFLNCRIRHRSDQGNAGAMALRVHHCRCLLRRLGNMPLHLPAQLASNHLGLYA